MRNIDLTPLYRTAIGFDRVANLLDSVSRSDQNNSSYPPYNIEVTGENRYRITMAVAGFSEDELNIELKPNLLTVSGSKPEREESTNFLHQGIASRSFERRFQLADYVLVENASSENGLLHIDLYREIPEEKKARTIKINSKGSVDSKLIDQN